MLNGFGDFIVLNEGFSFAKFLLSISYYCKAFVVFSIVALEKDLVFHINNLLGSVSSNLLIERIWSKLSCPTDTKELDIIEICFVSCSISQAI